MPGPGPHRPAARHPEGHHVLEPTTVATVTLNGGAAYSPYMDNQSSLVGNFVGCEAFSAKMAALAGETQGAGRKCYADHTAGRPNYTTKLGGWLFDDGTIYLKLRVRRSALFWQQARALVAQEADMTWEEFEYEYRRLTRSRLEQLRDERARQGRVCMEAGQRVFKVW